MFLLSHFISKAELKDLVALKQNLLQINILVNACTSYNFSSLTVNNDNEGRSSLGCCFKEKAEKETFVIINPDYVK